MPRFGRVLQVRQRQLSAGAARFVEKFKEAKNLHGGSSAEAWADWKILAVEAAEFEYERFVRQLDQLQLTAVGKLSTDD